MPAEVLASLPSNEEILAKAEAAKQRAAEAMKLRDAATNSPATPGAN